MPPVRFKSAACRKPRTPLPLVLGKNSSGSTNAADAERHGRIIASNDSEVVAEPASIMIEHESSGRRQLLAQLQHAEADELSQVSALL